MKKERTDNEVQPKIKNKNQGQNDNHNLSYDNNHPHPYETPLKQNQTSREDNKRQYQNQNVQLNRFQQEDSNLPQEIHYENDFENQKISEYSLESIRREDHIEDRITKHTLHKSAHFYQKLPKSSSQKQNKELKQEPEPEKPGIAMNLLNAFNQQKYG